MRLLIISRSFPPRNSARALQIGKVADAIAASGIDVLVLAGADESTTDCSHTPKNYDVVYVPYNRPQGGNRTTQKIFHSLWEQFNSINFFDPWVRQTVDRAQCLVEDFKPNCVLTSSMPFQTHLVGLAIKRLTGLPWIASFSDPWPSCYAPKPYFKRGIPGISSLEKYLFKLVVRSSDAIHMPSKHGIKWVEKVSGIPILQKGLPIQHIGSTTVDDWNNSNYIGWLAHIGHLSRERVSAALLKGIYDVHERIPERFKGLLCVGNVCPEFKKMTHDMGLDHIIKFTGQLSAKEATQIACAATALLVIEANMPMSPFLPSKFADYALTGKPILAITPNDSAIRNYLETYGGGKPACHDPTAITESLMELFCGERFCNFTESNWASESLAMNFHSTTIGRLYKTALFDLV